MVFELELESNPMQFKEIHLRKIVKAKPFGIVDKTWREFNAQLFLNTQII